MTFVVCAVFHPMLFPDLFRTRVHPLLRFPSSSEFHPALPAIVRRRWPPSLGFLLSFTTSVLESTCRWGSDAHLCSVLSVFRTLDDLLLLALCGFVSPRYRVRDFSSGVFPDNQPARLSPTRTLLSLTSQATCRLQGLFQLPIRCSCPSFTLCRYSIPS